MEKQKKLDRKGSGKSNKKRNMKKQKTWHGQKKKDAN